MDVYNHGTLTGCTASDFKGSIKVIFNTITTSAKLFMLYYNYPGVENNRMIYITWLVQKIVATNYLSN
jgi:hypothetical protein